MKLTFGYLNGFPCLIDETGMDVAKMYNETEAAEIITAVNAFHELLDEIVRLRQQAATLADALEIAADALAASHDLSQSEQIYEVKRARAALATYKESK